MRFKGLDLNLLIALDALLTERNVSAAARKVFLSQSAMSGALARLREHFGDELLVPVGRRMVLTSAAELLAEPLRQLVLQIEATVGASLKFDASTSTRTFVVHASDYVTEVVLNHVVPMIAREAPGVVLEIVPPLSDPAASLESGDVDLLITPESYASEHHPSELLYEEQHVVVGWNGNPALAEPLSLDSFFTLGHVVTRFAATRAIAPPGCAASAVRDEASARDHSIPSGPGRGCRGPLAQRPDPAGRYPSVKPIRGHWYKRFS